MADRTILAFLRIIVLLSGGLVKTDSGKLPVHKIRLLVKILDYQLLTYCFPPLKLVTSTCLYRASRSTKGSRDGAIHDPIFKILAMPQLVK
jgi:hypothetical protein